MKKPLRAAIYCRISADREGDELGVTRQREDCIKKVAELQATVVGLDDELPIVENDVSASTRSKKKRPKYAAMLEMARRGEIDAIIAYSNSRLTRRPAELEDLIRLYEDHGTTIHTVVSGRFDLSTADGRMQARLLATIDAGEAERTAERVSRAALQAAEKGLWHGGPRPFGFEADGTTIRGSEAEAIRGAYAAVIAGASVRSIAMQWNRAGFRTGRGNKEWTIAGVRELLCSARYAGLRSYRGAVVADAEWDAVVTEEDWQAVRAILRAETRKRGPASPKRLLTGVAICGECGAAVHCRGGAAGRPAYRCSAGDHLSRTAEPIDDMVAAVVAGGLSKPETRRAITDALGSADGDNRSVVADLTAWRDRLTELAGAFADGAITAEQLRAASTALRTRIDAAERTLAAHTGGGALRTLLSAEDVQTAWSRLDVAERRELVKALVTVTILRAVRGRKGFDAASVRIEWRS